MPTFRYSTFDSPAAGSMIDAPDRGAAVRALLARGITPLAVEPVGGDGTERAAARTTPGKADGQGSPGTRGAAPTDGRGGSGNGVAGASASGAAKGPVNGSAAGAGVGAASAGSGVSDGLVVKPAGRMSLGETAGFIRELATAVSAGLPIVPALRTIARAGRSAYQAAMLAHLLAEVERGRTLADAMKSWGKPFGELVVSLVKAGESSGKLVETMEQCGELLEKDVALRRSVLSATLYPMILLALVTAAIVVMMTLIVPQVLASVGPSLKTLPLPTRIVKGAAEFMVSYWWAITIAMALGVFGWRAARTNPATRLSMDRAALRLPLFGVLMRDALVARFTRTLGTLVSAGLPLLSALRLTGATLTNRAMQTALNDVCDQVAGGKTLAEPLEKTGLFPPLLVQIVNLGERSGRLPQLLQQATGSLDETTKARVKVLNDVLPVLIILVVAAIIGLVIAAIMLPLLEMQNAAGS